MLDGKGIYRNDGGYFLRYDVRTEIADTYAHGRIPQSTPQYGGLNRSMDFVNSTNRPITVGFRDGTKITIHPRGSTMLQPGLYIYTYLHYDTNLAAVYLPDITIGGQINAITVSSFQEQEKERFTLQTSVGSRQEVRGRHWVEPRELEEFGTLYIRNLDIVLSIDPIDTWAHPFSDDGLRRKAFSNLSKEDPGFALHIEITTNRPELDGAFKFVNLGGQVYSIPIRYVVDDEVGIRVTNRGLTTRTRAPRDETTIFKTWDKIDELPYKFFDTYTDAEHLGNIELSRKRHILDLEHANKVLQQELEHLKNHYARQQQDRKDVSDLMKWVPSIIGSCIALFMMLTKIAVHFQESASK